ncbi:MAG: threonine synthase [Clostridia bacterium]|nr:threonine synthase [Clostridia bacterium]
MNYVSTRGFAENNVSSAEAIKRGLAPDGGLYMPETMPKFGAEFIKSLIPLSYAERSSAVLSAFLTDYTKEELLTDAALAYAEEKFGPSPAPVSSLHDMHVLELWHGPTCAFKDMALQLMPRLFTRALKKCGEDKTALILVATSGDTGKAAMEGYRDIPGTKIQVFFPTDGVSRVQKLQMQTGEGENVSVMAIRGNFDDAQTGVKRIFSDASIREELAKNNIFLSSANSINWGRLVPQVAYYVSAYCDMVASGAIRMGEEIDITVPTGNFGNIFAAYIAKLCGLPFHHLVCASNRNNVLTDFLANGVYDRNRPFMPSISPSMDILISSNLERLLYLVCGADRTANYMKALSENGSYKLTDADFAKIKETFVGYYTTEEQTKETIRLIFQKENYLIDTHTAVAAHAAAQYKSIYKAERKMLTVSTASPYKFAKDVLNALDPSKDIDGLEALEALRSATATEIPAPLSGLDRKSVRFSTIIDKDEMADAVMKFAAN